MANLPHIKNNVVAQNNDEAATVNRYEIQVLPPAGVPIADTLKDEIMQVTGLDGIDKLPEIIRQKSKGHTRIFSGSFVDDTTLEIGLTINLNFAGKKANDLIIYKMFKGWARMQRDDRSGATGLKKDYVGSLILDQHNKVGDVWRHLECINVVISEITGLDEASIDNEDPVQLQVNLTVESFNVEYGG